MGYPPQGIGDMTKAVYDPDRDGVIAEAQLFAAVCSETEADGKITTHAEGASHRWTDEMLRKGAGSEAAPDEIVIPTALSSFSEGNLLLASEDTSEYSNSTTYVIIKTITLPINLKGTLRIKFDLKRGGEPQTAYGRIYRNGEAVGEVQTNDTTAHVTKSEDIAGWSEGDVIGLYVKVSVEGAATYVENFRVYANMYELVTSG